MRTIVLLVLPLLGLVSLPASSLFFEREVGVSRSSLTSPSLKPMPMQIGARRMPPRLTPPDSTSSTSGSGLGPGSSLSSSMFPRSISGSKRQTDVGHMPPASQADTLGSEQAQKGSGLSDDAKTVMLQLTNQERAARGLNALQSDDNLSFMAQEWADEIARRHKLIHRNEAGASTLSHARASSLMSFGENLYATDKGRHAAVPIVGWMQSEGHRRNMLQPAYNRVGFGIAHTRDGRVWIVAEYGGTRGSGEVVQSIPTETPIVTDRNSGPPL